MSDPRQYAEINRSLLVLIPKVEQPVSIKWQLSSFYSFWIRA
uniref:Uncharacterized protein n=1 Tax=Brassica campestris TaxID=3711 RepID=A0A3P6D975_BRACM|nr:unnamed protein product [Brassica rapa]VDD26779.1 unnamed protein product [Brassica rapa]